MPATLDEVTVEWLLHGETKDYIVLATALKRALLMVYQVFKNRIEIKGCEDVSFEWILRVMLLNEPGCTPSFSRRYVLKEGKKLFKGVKVEPQNFDLAANAIVMVKAASERVGVLKLLSNMHGYTRTGLKYLSTRSAILAAPGLTYPFNLESLNKLNGLVSNDERLRKLAKLMRPILQRVEVDQENLVMRIRE